MAPACRETGARVESLWGDPGRDDIGSILRVPPAIAQPDQEGAVRDMASFFAQYAERYMASDVDAISALYEAPLLAVREGRAIHLPDRTAVSEHLAELMQAYQSAGAARADIAEIDVLPLGKSGAMTTVRWHVVDEAGTILRDFRSTYHLLHVDEAWRILSYTNHDH